MMRSFKRAAYKVGFIEDPNLLECTGTLEADGSVAIYEVDIHVGIGIGTTGITYQAGVIPDRFQLYFDGELVADSKYVGDGLTSRKSQLLGVEDKELQVLEFNGRGFSITDRVESITITESDIANGSPSQPTSGRGELTFEKTKTDVTSMRLKVTGAVGSATWSIFSICPHENIDTGEEEEEEETTPTPPIPVPTPPTRAITYRLKYSMNSNGTCIMFNPTDLLSYGTYYSDKPLYQGNKLYTDTQLMNKARTGFYYRAGIIYQVRLGEIISEVHCVDGGGNPQIPVFPDLL